MREWMISEWERVWARRKTRVLLVVFPVVVFLLEQLNLRFGVGFYDADHTAPLNVLNFPVFSLRDLSFLITFIIAPLFWVDSFSGEAASGAYRMVLLRPYSRGKMLMAKWLVQAGLSLGILLIPFVMSQMVGWVSLPHPESVSFFYEGIETYGTSGALLYHLGFYGWIYLILLACLGVCGTVGVVMPNGVLAFIGYVGVLIGMIYVSDSLLILVISVEEVFKLMASASDPAVFYALFGTLAISAAALWGIWTRKDWVH
ncbi:ABC transporter permease subunit [Paludifilum halophilum]|uniref:ABC transporter permease n=1 Tax=Paludifilum halophilum TaxID=1642702 RepID=A0A235B8Z4_9BACL|nr:ABC transporter permease subunit [Paludifilum halophilum]OYD08469.1 hypothetical protein CHM34_06470 [Paludifilum halophilum]